MKERTENREMEPRRRMGRKGKLEEREGERQTHRLMRARRCGQEAERSL